MNPLCVDLYQVCWVYIKGTCLFCPYRQSNYLSHPSHPVCACPCPCVSLPACAVSLLVRCCLMMALVLTSTRWSASCSLAAAWWAVCTHPSHTHPHHCWLSRWAHVCVGGGAGMCGCLGSRGFATCHLGSRAGHQPMMAPAWDMVHICATQSSSRYA